jgi:hypothetical protein
LKKRKNDYKRVRLGGGVRIEETKVQFVKRREKQRNSLSLSLSLHSYQEIKRFLFFIFLINKINI